MAANNEYFKIFSGLTPDVDLNTWLEVNEGVEILDYKFSVCSNLHRAICIWYRRKKV